MRSGLFLSVLLLGGCAGTQQLAARPAGWDEQREALLKLVPLGTPRDEVGRRLKESGVDFSPSGESGPWTPGMNASLFYCDRWSRPGGQAWLLEAQLLFDAEGKLYQIRPSQGT